MRGPRKPTTRVIAGPLAATAALVAALALGAAPAAAGTCPDKETVLPAKGDDPDPPYQCAQMNSSDNKKLSAWETKSWSSTPGAGYYNKTTCKYKDNSNVDITAVDAGEGLGSYTATATNWDIDKSHHFAAGVLWATGNVEDGGYSSGCADDNEDGDIENSILELSSLEYTEVPTTATVGQEVKVKVVLSPSDAYGYIFLLANGQPANLSTYYSSAPISEGSSVAVRWYPREAGEYELQMLYNWSDYDQDITDKRVSCPSTAKTCGWSASAEDEVGITVSEATTTTASAPAAATTQLALRKVGDLTGATPEGLAAAVDAAAKAKPAGLVTKTRTRRMPSRLGLSCKDGQMPMYAEAMTRGSGNPRVRYGNGGARVVGRKALRGQRIALQLSCRKRSATLLGQPHLLLGSKRDDTVKTRRPRMGVFAGPGADRVSVASKGSFAHGGLHADRIKVKAADGVATGDAGRDLLEAKTRSRTLLVGGQDADQLIGSKGRTLINAADGRADDVVVCNGRGNKVLADRGDTVRGPCGLVRRQGG